MNPDEYVKKVKKLVADISPERARKLIAEFNEKVERREQHGICACGTPCQNPIGHNAADKIIVLELTMILARATVIS